MPNVLLITKSLPLMNSENIYTLNFFDPEPAFIQKSPRQVPAPSELTNHLGEAKTDISSKVQRARAGWQALSVQSAECREKNG